jgi:ribosomal protein S18 acetylase RimI-like enzyme
LPIQLTIRNATVADIPLIRDLTYMVWPQTYSTILTREQIDYMLELIYSEASLQKQMNDKHYFIIVYEGNLPVGFASYSETEPQIYKLHKIYVLPNQQGKGTGGFVIDHIITIIKANGAKRLQLNVNRKNKAKDFYDKLGFATIREENIDIGSGYFMNDYIMEKRL